MAVGLVARLCSAQAASPPKVEVALLANRTAAVPGQAIELAVRFKIPEGWHIYWRNWGDSGLAPSFQWRLPEGFAVGPMQYPLPRRHVDAGDLHTFILEGEPAILTELKVPPGLPPDRDVKIGVDVRWLVCRHVCVPGHQSLSLALPVASEAGGAKPAHEIDFQIAHEQLPLPMARARHLKRLWAAASADKVKPGAKFEVAVVVEVADDHHIYSNRPLDKAQVPTDVFNDATEGLVIGRPRFPQGRIERPPGLDEEVSLYRGRNVIVLPVEADAELAAKELRIGGVVTYQACDDRTRQCFRPTGAQWELTLPVAGREDRVSPANAEIFGGAPAGPATAPGGAASRAASAVSREAGGGSRAASAETPTTSNERGEAANPDSGAGDGRAGPASPTTSDSWLGRVQGRLIGFGVVGYLVLALIGGFLLNLMPCVLPVVSIKVLSFVQQARESRLRVLTLGLAFAAGIQLSFLVLGVLIVLAGQQWGGLFQHPQVLIGLAAVVTAFALSLFGVFALFPPRFINELGQKVQQEGHLSALGMGLLATVLGTACTAPFLAQAIAVASQQTTTVGLLIFAVAGLGMALPYVLLAAKPVWLRFVPRPGAWMATFEHVMGFCLLGTVVWLFSALNTQIGGPGTQRTLLFLLCVSVGVWCYGKVEWGSSVRKKVAGYGAAGALVIGGWLVCFRVTGTIPEMVARQRELMSARDRDWLADPDWNGPDIPWVRYTRERARQAVAAGWTVFIDYTADWCVNCKANEKAVLNTAPVREAMQRLGVLPFRADFTLNDLDIKADLDKYGSGGVPLYLVIPAHRPDDVIRLDELLTKASVIRALESAGPSVRAGTAVVLDAQGGSS